MALAEFYLVLHLRHGSWTHLYRLVEGARATRFQLFLEKAVEGDAREEFTAFFRGTADSALAEERQRDRGRVSAAAVAPVR